MQCLFMDINNVGTCLIYVLFLYGVLVNDTLEISRMTTVLYILYCPKSLTELFAVGCI